MNSEGFDMANPCHSFAPMTAKTKRRIGRSVIALLAIYLIGGIVLYFFQGLILFHPAPLPKDHKFSFDQPFEEVNYKFQTDNLSIVKFRPSTHRKGIVLFFHGNMNNVEHYKKYPSLFTRNGYEIWMIDYPGFGKTTGKRTESVMYEQALVFFGLAKEETAHDSILIYGKSIGTGVASYVASVMPCKKLILETPYYSIEAMARHFFPIYPPLLTKFSFPNHAYLKKIRSAISIFHGTDDEVVPYQQGKKLAEENKTIELITIENGKHNNLFEFELYQRKMDSLLK